MNEYIKLLEKLCKMYEEKLEKLLGKEKFSDYMQNCAQILFMDSVDKIEDTEFKEFILDNLDDIFKPGGNDKCTD